jgi:predicted ester cyclase
MSTNPEEKNAALIKKLFALVEKGDYVGAAELVAPTFRGHIAGQTLDRDAWLGFAKMFMGGFPDGVHTWDEVITKGDRVVMLTTFTGTHTGEFNGIAPTGKRISFPAILVDRVVDGRVVEHRGEFDPTIMMKQLGVMPGGK